MTRGDNFLIFSSVLLRGEDLEKRALKYRRGRLGEALREELETLVEGELADPRIRLVRVSGVHLAHDGRSAQVLVDADGNDEEAERRLEGLEAAREISRPGMVEGLPPQP